MQFDLTLVQGGAVSVMPAETCVHEWEACLTPPDSASRWYRCNGCKSFGYRKLRGGSRFLVPYRCANKGCRRPAIDRLTGRGPRLGYRWRCRECIDD